jgi:hypothetical protein
LEFGRRKVEADALCRPGARCARPLSCNTWTRTASRSSSARVNASARRCAWPRPAAWLSHRYDEEIDDEPRGLSAIAAERRADRYAAKAFARACELGDAEQFLVATGLVQNAVDGWRLALKKVARLSSVSDEIKAAFLNVWIETKMLPLYVGDRRVLVDALRVLLPVAPQDKPMHLFRGTSVRERRHRIYGFSWTTRLDIARRFAEHWQSTGLGGVVLETTAPADAILLVREDEAYYDEGEIVVDPFRLISVKAIK